VGFVTDPANQGYTVNENLSLVDHPTEDYKRIIAVNQDGVYYSIKYAGRSMVSCLLALASRIAVNSSNQQMKNPAKEGKSIIVISSTAGIIGQFGFAYTASKFAVRGMTKRGFDRSFGLPCFAN
jgi:NAD(P)-dependent dehydrogenase (short-subunit alcohol dehydrogenase family)